MRGLLQSLGLRANLADVLEAADAATIEGRVMELRQALDGSDVADIRARTEALSQAAQPLAEALYAQAQTAQAAPPTGDGGAVDDEIVEDADYEVIDEEEGAART